MEIYSKIPEGKAVKIIVPENGYSRTRHSGKYGIVLSRDKYFYYVRIGKTDYDYYPEEELEFL